MCLRHPNERSTDRNRTDRLAGERLVFAVRTACFLSPLLVMPGCDFAAILAETNSPSLVGRKNRSKILFREEKYKKSACALVKLTFFSTHAIAFPVHPKKHLSFAALRNVVASRVRTIPDKRQESKVIHCIHDVVMSAFAMMFFQDPSLLQFQKRMEEARQTTNQALFCVSRFPKIPGCGKRWTNLTRNL